MSRIVSTDNTNSSLTVYIYTDDNSNRKQLQTLNVVIKMKSLHYSRTWQTTGEIDLNDPCFDNTVEALPAKTFILSAQVTFETSSKD